MKSGELLALSDVSPFRKGQELRPVLVPASALGGRLLNKLITCWGRDDHFFLDARFLQATDAAGSIQVARNAGLRPIPVVAMDFGLEKVEALAPHIQDIGRASIRLPGTRATGSDCEARLNSLVGMLGIPISAIDLFVDFGVVREAVEFHRANAVRVFEFLPRFEAWRSVYYAATSFPESVSDLEGYEEIEDGVFRIITPRVELETYQALLEAGFQRQLGFSDSSVCFGEFSAEAPPAFRPTANLRYTRGELFIILKGVHENGNEDMIRLCQALLTMPEYRGPAYSVGDNSIERCATTEANYGQSQQWRRWDHNHNFEETMNQVASFA